MCCLLSFFAQGPHNQCSAGEFVVCCPALFKVPQNVFIRELQWLVFMTLLHNCHSADLLLICYFCLQVHGPRRVVCRATLDDPELDDLMARMEEQV